MEIAKKTLSSILVVFTIIIILLNLYIFYVKIILKQDIVKICGYSILVIISGSMEPELMVDDLIIIKEDIYKNGDIITYKSNNSFVTHRIIDIDGDFIYTKGDSNNVPDDPITQSQIQGKVIYKIKHFGKFTSFLSSPIGITICIIIFFILIRVPLSRKGTTSKENKVKAKHSK